MQLQSFMHGKALGDKLWRQALMKLGACAWLHLARALITASWSS